MNGIVLFRRVEEFKEYGDMDMMMQYVKEVQTVQKKLSDSVESIGFINEVCHSSFLSCLFYPTLLISHFNILLLKIYSKDVKLAAASHNKLTCLGKLKVACVNVIPTVGKHVTANCW